MDGEVRIDEQPVPEARAASSRRCRSQPPRRHARARKALAEHDRHSKTYPDRGAGQVTRRLPLQNAAPRLGCGRPGHAGAATAIAAFLGDGNLRFRGPGASGSSTCGPDLEGRAAVATSIAVLTARRPRRSGTLLPGRNCASSREMIGAARLTGRISSTVNRATRRPSSGSQRWACRARRAATGPPCRCSGAPRPEGELRRPVAAGSRG